MVLLSIGLILLARPWCVAPGRIGDTIQPTTSAVHELEQYDEKTSPSYDTTFEPLARTQPADHPVWASCLEPEPDLECLLSSSEIFAVECVDEAFDPCVDE